MHFNHTQLVSAEGKKFLAATCEWILVFFAPCDNCSSTPNTSHKGIVPVVITSRNTNLFLWHSKRVTSGRVSFPKKRLKAGRVPENLFRTSTSKMSSAPPRNTNSYKGTYIRHLMRLHSQTMIFKGQLPKHSFSSCGRCR